MELYSYRICKYDPQYRTADGAYQKAEWTDFSDIGKVYEGKLFTEAEYIAAETRHIACVQALLCRSDVETLTVSQFEGVPCGLENGQSVPVAALEPILRSCLRNEYWCVLSSANAFVHLGYDYYLYVGCTLPFDEAAALCRSYGLFCNRQFSPYSDSAQ